MSLLNLQVAGSLGAAQGPEREEGSLPRDPGIWGWVGLWVVLHGEVTFAPCGKEKGKGK